MEEDLDTTARPLGAFVSPYRPTTDNHPRPIRRYLYLACAAANLASFSIGNCFTWTSPILPLLQQPNDILHLSLDQCSWVGSLIALGATGGPLLAGVVAPRLGRKPALTLAVLLLLASWLGLLAARGVWLMYLSRAVAGVGGGIIYTVVPMYVAEIAETELRGALVSMMSFSVCVGFLLVYLVGPLTTYYSLIHVCLLPPLLFLALFPAFMPESPYFLLQTGQGPRALRSLMWLRRGLPLEKVQHEFQQMKVSVAAQQGSGGLRDLLGPAGARRGLLLSCGLVAGQQLSGINVVIFYAESIFQQSGSRLSPALCSILVAVVLILASTAAPALVKRRGVKLLLILSAAGMALFQGFLGLYFFLLHLKVELEAWGWVPVSSLVGYIIMYAIGFGPLPWAVMAEVFAPQVKALGSSVTASVCWFFAFLMTKYFIDVSASLGEYISFWLFTICCLLMVFFTLFLLPETRGKTFDEIQDILNNRIRHAETSDCIQKLTRTHEDSRD